MENYLKLTPRLRRFAEAIAEGETATAAARRVRPHAKNPKAQGYQWRHHPVVKAAIDELQEAVRQDFRDREIRHKLAVFNRANADRSPLLSLEFWNTDPKGWPDEVKDCIESVEFKDGKLSKVTLSSRNDASRLFAQMQAMLTERHEVTGKDGAPLANPAESAAAAAVAIAAAKDPNEAAAFYRNLMRGDG